MEWDKIAPSTILLCANSSCIIRSSLFTMFPIVLTLVLCPPTSTIESSTPIKSDICFSSSSCIFISPLKSLLGSVAKF